MIDIFLRNYTHLLIESPICDLIHNVTADELLTSNVYLLCLSRQIIYYSLNIRI